MSTLKITVDDRSVRYALSQLALRLNDARPTMALIADKLLEETHTIFNQEGLTSGGWQDLRPSTIRARSKKGYWPGKILEQRGALLSSIVRGYGADYAQVASSLNYAPVHFFGATIERQGEVRLRTNRKGKLLGQKSNENLAVFAKRSHKLAVTRAVNYQIVIPARPFFPITETKSLTPNARQAVFDAIRYSLLSV